jgi:chromosome segregation ATPase
MLPAERCYLSSLFTGRLQSLHGELEQAKQREGKLTEDNRQLSEKVSSLEKECASLSLELKAAENRYQQEVRAHEETERSRLVSKEEANLEVVKGEKRSLNTEKCKCSNSYLFLHSYFILFFKRMPVCVYVHGWIACEIV